MKFDEYASQPDEHLDLLTGALLIARDAYPELSLTEPSDHLDALAWELGSLVGCEPRAQARALARYLYDKHGFRGNTDDYYDPRNSFINQVLERRLGIPISLSVVYTEVARRVGVQARGINFPGHFLVRIDGSVDEPPCIVDAFTKGRVLTRRSLALMLARTERDVAFDESLLNPAGVREVLIRFLTNLRAIYTTQRDVARLVVVLSRLTELSPRSAVYVRDRGLAAAKLGAARAAISDFERYLELAPDAEEGPEVRKLIAKLREQRSVLH